MKILALLLMAVNAHAITVNPASAVTADSANTALTIPYRDANGAFQMGALTATSITNTSGTGSLSASTVTINGDTNSACLSIGSTFTVNCQTGRVGIGTTAPAFKLHVSSGGMALDGTSPTILIGPTNVAPAGTGGGGIHISGINDSGVAITNPSAVDLELRLVGTNGQVGTFDDHPMSFMQNGTARITAAAGGNLGIGTTAPATKLHLSSGTITIDGTGAPTTAQALCLDAGGKLGHCTSAVGAGGGCTCSAP